MAYVVNANDASTPTEAQGATQGAEELRALKTKIASVVAGAIVVGAAAATPADLVTLVQPDVNDRPSMVAGGWLPWNLNQQWGGAPMPFHLVDSATGVEYKFDAFDQYIDTDSIDFAYVGDVAGQYYVYQSFTSAKIQTLNALWLKLGKRGNPVDNFTVQLYTVAAGVPGALVATANVVNGKQIVVESANLGTAGQWYRFAFGAGQVLAANTQYMIVASKSAGVDAANRYHWQTIQTTRYPSNLHGKGTVAPVWTADNGKSRVFICETQASDQVVQSAGTFNGKIVGTEGNPINRSVGFIKPLREFFPLFHPNGWSILLRGKSWNKDKTIADVIYGLHHDRINIRSATATGFTTVTIYEQDGTVNTLVGTSDISGAAYKDILIVGRSMNDGGDYCKIYTGINNVWTKEIEATAQTYTFDPLMQVQGHMWIMGGFPLFKNTDYTKLSEMTILPSADGWTFTTASATVEGNVFAVSGGKLSQIKSGMAAGGDGSYVKAAAAFSNVNGSFIATKIRIVNATNTKGEDGSTILWRDGVRQVNIKLHEYFIQPGQSGGAFVGGIPQVDLKSADCTVFAMLKGNDVLTFCNGKLIADHTGANTVVDATNDIRFGDLSGNANENHDAVWDYFGYYNTAVIYPQFTSGELHEFGVWAGDKNLLGAALYNLGVPYSIKQYCGIGRNFIGEQAAIGYKFLAVTNEPTSNAATSSPAVLAEMECFALGKLFTMSNEVSLSAAGVVTCGTSSFIDGQDAEYGSLKGGLDTNFGLGTGRTVVSSTANYVYTTAYRNTLRTNFGLHKLDVRGGNNSGGASVNTYRRRTLSVEARANG